MDEKKILIILNGEDKTKDIELIEEIEDKIKVKFKNAEKKYSYDKVNVIVKEEAEVIDCSDKDIYYKGLLLLNIDKVIRFEEWIKVIFKNNYTKVLEYDKVSFKNIEKKNATKDIISYFKEIAKYVDGGNDENEGDESKETFLEREYNKISYVEHESVLSYYINKKDLVQNEDGVGDIIFPFGFNISQRKAVENVYKSNISIINGPPGTGKTQTILNIVANLAIMQGKTVAVVSNNNEAVKNVRDKLNKNGYGFICASLGRKKNREKFFDNLPKITLKGFDTNYDIDELLAELRILNVKLDKLLELNNERAKLEREINNYKLEQKHFNNYYEEQGIVNDFIYPETSDKILELLFEIQMINERATSYNLMYRISSFFKCDWLYNKLREVFYYKLLYKTKMALKYNIKDIDDFKENFLDYISGLQKEFYVVKIEELVNDYNNVVEILEQAKFDKLQERHKFISTVLWQKRLYDRYNNLTREEFDIKNYKRNINKFLERFPVVLSTTYSLRNSIPEGFMFDYVIMDEASQVDLLAGSLALACAKNAIIVGDENNFHKLLI